MSNAFERVNYSTAMKMAEKFFIETKLRKEPWVDVIEGARALGAQIVESSLKGDVSGFLFVPRAGAPVIGINQEQSIERKRFTVAHELGHLFLHVAKEVEVSFIDKSFSIFNRDVKSSSGVAIAEIEANFFAAEILMPAENLYREVSKAKYSDLSDIHRRLAVLYHVSEQAMMFRLNNLGFVRFGDL